MCLAVCVCVGMYLYLCECRFQRVCCSVWVQVSACLLLCMGFNVSIAVCVFCCFVYVSEYECGWVWVCLPVAASVSV